MLVILFSVIQTYTKNIYIIAMGGSKVCDPQNIVEPGFGEGYQYLKHSRSKLAEEFKAVQLQYKVPHIPPLVRQTNKMSL